MNDLVISLIGLGILAMIGVIAYNKWQEHKARKSMESSFPSDFHDALMVPPATAPAAEPSPKADSPAKAGSADSAFVRREPSFAQAVAEQEQSAMVASSQTSFEPTVPQLLTPELASTESAAPQSDAPPKVGDVMAADLPTPQSATPQSATPEPTPVAVKHTAGHSVRTEPQFGPVSASTDTPEDSARLLSTLGDGEPVHVEQQAMEAVVSQAKPDNLAPSDQPRQLSVDELIDCVIPMGLQKPVLGASALAQFAFLEEIGGKSVRYIGQDQSGRWGELQPKMNYQMLVAGIQLANRVSPLTRHDFTEAMSRLSQSASVLGAAPEIPEMASIVGTASSLHHFIQDHDVTLGFNIRSASGPWGLSTLLSALTRQGFDRQSDGTLVMSDGEDGALFSLSTNVTGDATSTSLLSLGLRIPLVASERRAYQALVSCAKALAARLGGTIVDDSGQLLNDSQLHQIGAQVDAFYQNMASSGIEAGSHRARRLFA